MFGLSSLYMKLIGGLVAALIVLGLVAERGRWMHRAHSAEAENATVCAAVRAAADNPKMDCRLAAQQVGLLGSSLKSTTDALNRQNAAVTALSVESKRQQDEAVKAQSAAKERVKAAQSMSDRLARSASDPAREKAPCEPSKALKGAWR